MDKQAVPFIGADPKTKAPDDRVIQSPVVQVLKRLAVFGQPELVMVEDRGFLACLIQALTQAAALLRFRVVLHDWRRRYIELLGQI